MSRKAREEKTSWKMPSVDVFVGEYGPFRTKGHDPIDNALVWFHCSSTDGDGHHALHSLAGMAQNMILQQQDDNSRFRKIVSINLRNMFECSEYECEYEEALAKEIEEVPLTKKFGKTLLRLLQRLHLKNAFVAAEKDLCALLIKLYQAMQRTTDSDVISELWLLHPDLSTKFVNTHLVESPQSGGGKRKNFSAKVRMVLEKKKNNRLGVLSHFFQMEEKPLLIPNPNNWFSVIAKSKDSSEKPNPYDPEFINPMGKQLFLSHVKVEMNRYTKQYERICDDITPELAKITLEKPAEELIDATSLDWSTCDHHVGALILRGNRCVLARSLKKEWGGMRIPSVLPKPGESPQFNLYLISFPLLFMHLVDVRLSLNCIHCTQQTPTRRSLRRR